MQETSSIVNSVINNRKRDCLGCRMFSGIGLLGSGLYVYHHTKKFQGNITVPIMYSIGSALIALGIARVLDLPPFRDQFSDEQS